MPPPSSDPDRSRAAEVRGRRSKEERGTAERGREGASGRTTGAGDADARRADDRDPGAGASGDDPNRRPDAWRELGRRRQALLHVRHEIALRRTPATRAVEWIGNVLGDARFFFLFLLAHVIWVVANLGVVPGIPVWDPPPFVLLATVASAEAPFIALLILMAQGRSRRIQELRDEIDLQVALYMERQVSVALEMLHDIQERLGMDPEAHEEFRLLAEPLDPRQLLDEINEELAHDEEGGRRAED